MAAKPDELEFINVVDHGSSGSRTPGAPGSSYGQANGNSLGGTGLGAGSLGFIRQSQHPMTAFFHYAFKVAAILFYLFGSIFFNYIFVCVVCILLLAFDFWTVKNISGRLMVGLRWWSNVKEDGTNEWVFESLENMTEVNSADSKLFWIGLYGTPVIWLGFFMLGLLQLQIKWLVIVVMALLLNGANIYGYTKCSNDAKNKVMAVM
ncbi:unnamed protein product, partial [Discosporangium mesarthrocarpum]